MKHILVTGGAGFIGSHLCAKALELGYRITIIDDLSQADKNKVIQLQANKYCQFIEEDITTSSFEHTLSSLDKVDIVFHLAAPVGVIKVMQSNVELFQQHFFALKHLIEFAKVHQSDFFYASSSEVYGNQVLNEKLSEDDAMSIEWFKDQGQRYQYGMLKIQSELELVNHLKYQRVIIGRFFNVFGEGQLSDFGMVLPNFIASAIQNKPIEVFGDGSSIRCFTPVDWAVDCIFKLFESNTKEQITVNIGADKPITIKELAYLIKNELNSESEIVFSKETDEPGRIDAIHTRIPNNSHLNKVLTKLRQPNWEESLKKYLHKMSTKTTSN